MGKDGRRVGTIPDAWVYKSTCDRIVRSSHECLRSGEGGKGRKVRSISRGGETTAHVHGVEYVYAYLVTRLECVVQFSVLRSGLSTLRLLCHTNTALRSVQELKLQNRKHQLLRFAMDMQRLDLVWKYQARGKRVRERPDVRALTSSSWNVCIEAHAD